MKQINFRLVVIVIAVLVMLAGVIYFVMNQSQKKKYDEISENHIFESQKALWTQDLSAYVVDYAVDEENKHVYLVTGVGKVYKVSVENGEIIETYSIPEEVYSLKVLLVDNQLIMGARIGRITVLDVGTKAIVFDKSKIATSIDDVEVANGMVYCSGKGVIIRAYSIQDSSLEWQYRVKDSSEHASISFEYYNNTIVMYNLNDELVVLDSDSGKVIDTLSIPLYRILNKRDNFLYCLGDLPRILYKFDLDKNKVMWKREMDIRYIDHVVGGRVYYRTPSGDLGSIDDKDGTPVFEIENKDKLMTTSAIWGDYAITRADGKKGQIQIFNNKDGGKVEEFLSFPNPFKKANLIVVDDYLIFPDGTGVVMAYNLNDLLNGK